jgi:hypothetical protein
VSAPGGAPIGVAVVHGVGDPKPGETLDSVVEGLCGRNESLIVEARGRRVIGGADGQPAFVVRQRRLVNTSSGTRILVSEVFWADVGKVGAGWWAVVNAVASLAMGLHALIFAGGGVSGQGPRPHLPEFTKERTWLRAAFWTAFVGAYHIKGVLTPLAIILLLFAWLSLVWHTGTAPPVESLFLFPLIGALAFIVPWIMPTVAAGVWCLVGYVMPICGVLLGMSMPGQIDGRLLGLVLSAAFGVCHTLVVVYTLRSEWQSGIRGLAKRAAVCIPAVLWLALAVVLILRDSGQVMRNLGAIVMSAYHVALGLAALWVFVIAACCSFAWFTPEIDQRDRGKVIFLGYALEFSLWVAIAATLGWLAWRLPDLTWLDVETAYGPGTWFPLVPTVFVASLAVTLLIAPRVGRSRRRSTFEIGHLVGSWPLPVVTIATAIICVMAVATAVNLTFLPSIGVHPAMTAIAAGVLATLVFVVQSFREPLLHGLDLANDVALYFRGRSWASSIQHRSDELLKARFTSVMDDLVKDAKVGTLVVVAHSQGTVIAVDALRDWANVDVVDLLTLGSPLRGLYARFFGGRFRRLVPRVRRRAKSWLNLYRVDDYVGRRLGGGTDMPIRGTGHEGYWTDESVLKELERLIGLRDGLVPSPEHTVQGNAGTSGQRAVSP